ARTVSGGDMTARSFAEVSLKLLGLYWILSALTGVPNLISSVVGAPMAEGESRGALAATVFSLAFTLAVGAVTLASAARLARRLAPQEDRAQWHITREDLQAAAFSVVGAWLMITAIIYAGHAIYTFKTLEGTDKAWVRGEFVHKEWDYLIGNAVRL